MNHFWIGNLKRFVHVVHNPVSGWIVLALSLCLTIAAYWIAKEQIRIRANERFDFRSAEITSAIVERMAMYEFALRSGVALFNSSSHVSREDWRVFSESLQLSERLPGVQGIGYAIPLTAEQKASHVAEIRAAGFPEYEIKPIGEREVYSAIIYLEPFSWRNQRAHGYDMWSNSTRREAMARAKHSGESATSGSITLVQETEEDVQKGFLTYLPVYKTKNIPTTSEARDENFQGWIYAAFRARDLMNNVQGAKDRSLYFRIYDEFESEKNLLFVSNPEMEKDVQRAELKRMENLIVQGRRWQVTYHASERSILSAAEVKQPLYVLVAALIVDVMLFYVIISLHLINQYSNKKRNELEEDFEKNQQSLTAQAKLIESTEKEARTFFELAPDAFLIVNQQGVVVRANQRANRMFGYINKSLVGCNIEMLVPAGFREQHKHYRENFQKTSMSRMMAGGTALSALRDDGTQLQVEINLVPIELQGEKHWVAALHDVSLQKQVEASLEDAKLKAESASRSKSEFVANMSHEIRTPLNAVLGAAQLLQRTQLDVEQSRYLAMVKSSGETLLGIINDILDFSKIEAGKMTLAEEPFSLNDVLHRLANIMSVSVNEKEINLNIVLSPDVPIHYLGDGLRLQQVLINLASNAIKFTQKGEVNIEIDLLEEDAFHSRLLFKVSDTGIGMSEAQQQLLFSAFSQADTSITRRFGGTGLGLVISSKIVAMLGGEFTVSSEAGNGAQFSFTATLNRDSGLFAAPGSTVSEPLWNVAAIDSNQETLRAYDAIFSRWRWPVMKTSSWLDLYDPDILQNLDLIVFSVSADENFKQHIEQLQMLGLAHECSLVSVMDNQQQTISLSATLQQELRVTSISKPVTAQSLKQAINLSQVVEKEWDEGGVNSDIETNRHLQGKHVLLVEDNELNQAVAGGLLEDLNMHYVIANNGAEAIAMLENDKAHFDVILMDIQMPVMDGVSATTLIRRELQLQIPIIALTAGVLHSEIQSYLDVGMNGFVAKPIDFNELSRTMHHLLCDEPQDEFVHNVTTQEVSKSTPRLQEPEKKEFSCARMESISRGRPERVERLAQSIENIIASGSGELNKAKAGLLEGDIDEALRVLHSFKGVVANFGGEKLAANIQLLEEKIKRNDLTQAQSDFAALYLDFEGFCRGAQQWMNLSRTHT
ncbi:Signal transduction histidine-protein kinase BarA [Thalassocella blandensis]|nr:Signal transduction histidine-protein kinase BarA [Thalassocella blandensis]